MVETFPMIRVAYEICTNYVYFSDVLETTDERFERIPHGKEKIFRCLRRILLRLKSDGKLEGFHADRTLNAIFHYL